MLAGNDIFTRGSEFDKPSEKRYALFEPQFTHLHLPLDDFEKLSVHIKAIYEDTNNKVKCDIEYNGGCYFENTKCEDVEEKKESYLKLRVGDGFKSVVDRHFQITFMLQDDIFD